MKELPLLALIFAFLTLITLIVGIIIMAKGGKLNAKASNKLMVLRVTLQGIVIILIIASVILAL